MINLHAIYYRNIWPFENKECSLIFDQGKFLVKAPIGSGKSFLFFDGPTYALYRTANRNMLNIHSKEGEISLIFSVDESYYLVRRMLKPGKSKDSCSSQLFSLTPLLKGGRSEAPGGSGDRETNVFGRTTTPTGFGRGKSSSLLQRNTNIITELFTNPNIHLEEVVMKNETDLQQTLDQLIPPKPVFLSTIFLLQDAENIFEMQPADRLIVLKNVFWLLGIDEAKEQVQDKKRELGYKLKVLQDQSQQDGKLRRFLKGLYADATPLLKGGKERSDGGFECPPYEGGTKGGSKQNACNWTSPTPPSKGGLWDLKTFFTDLEPFLDQITLNDFTLNGLDTQLFLDFQEQLQTKEKSLLSLQTTKDHLLKQINEQTEQIAKWETEKKNLTSDIAALEMKIASMDREKVEKLKSEKVGLYEQLVPLTKGELKGVQIPQLEPPLPLLQKEGVDEVYTLIQTLKERGKDLANQVQLAEQKLKTLELEEKNQQMKIEQLEQAKKRLENFEMNIDEQATFSCEKIGANCPFIKVINKQHFEQLEKQKGVLKEEIVALEVAVTTPLTKGGGSEATGGSELEGTSWRTSPTPSLDRLGTGSSEGGRSQEIQTYKHQITSIKTFLNDIDYKSREEKYAQKEALQKQIHEKDQAIMQLEGETQKLQDYQQQKTAFLTSLENIERQIDELKAKSQKLKADLTELEQQIAEQQPEQLREQLQTVARILQTIHDIEQLITDATATKNLVKDLQQQEKLLSNLYTILSKEILLFALDEYLPVLSEIINSYLVQVVDYQIAMKITETAEKLELEAKIYDEKGEREVKSLSGGQRTILKLVRMLAISSYLQTPLLFLDETINNLDGDTIGKVSDMLDSFVKQRTMKFYTVTHNIAIQEMDIWDEVVEVSPL